MVSVCVTAGTALLSCKKETIKQTHAQAAVDETEKAAGYRTDGRMLIFNTVADYESVVNNSTPASEAAFTSAISQLGYRTYREALDKNPAAPDAVGHELLSMMLNKDRTMQIGNYLYHVNILTKQVLVLPASYIAEYNDLTTENTANAHVMVYSTEENVIELVESDLPSGMKKLCLESFANTRNESRPKTVTESASLYHTFTCEVRYYSGGVIFNLKSQILAQTHYYLNGWHVKACEMLTKIESHRRYKKRCENENPWYDFSDTGFTFYDANAVDHWKAFKLHSYQGSKGLNKYTLNSNFWYKDGNGIWQSAWEGADMYSGYHCGVSYGY